MARYRGVDPVSEPWLSPTLSVLRYPLRIAHGLEQSHDLDRLVDRHWTRAPLCEVDHARCRLTKNRVSIGELHECRVHARGAIDRQMELPGHALADLPDCAATIGVVQLSGFEASLAAAVHLRHAPTPQAEQDLE